VDLFLSEQQREEINALGAQLTALQDEKYGADDEGDGE
jgi:hypothetical protein